MSIESNHRVSQRTYCSCLYRYAVLSRNPGTYAGHIQAALQGAMSGNATGHPPAIDGSKVQLITPAFYALADQTHGALPSPDPHNRLCFLGDEWAWGSNSVCGDPAMTSYDAMGNQKKGGILVLDKRKSGGHLKRRVCWRRVCRE